MCIRDSTHTHTHTHTHRDRDKDKGLKIDIYLDILPVAGKVWTLASAEETDVKMTKRNQRCEQQRQLWYV